MAWVSGPVSTSAQTTQETEFPAAPVLADYLDWARLHNPDLASARARIETQRGLAHGQGALADLKLGWGEMIVPVETRVGPQRRVFSLSQSLSWPGTLGLSEAAGLVDVEAELAGLRGRALAVDRDVRSAWYQLAWVQGQGRILADHLDLARQAEVSRRAAYEVGSGAYSQVLAAQMEVGRLERRLAGLQDRVRAVNSRLQTAAGMDPGRPIPSADLPDSLLLARELPARARLLEIMESNHPGLAALDHRQESQRLRLDLAGKSGYPELLLGLDYLMTGPARMPDVAGSGKDPVIARVGINLPLWGGKAQAAKDAAAGRLLAAVADRRSLRLELIHRLDENLYLLREARRELALHDDVLLPRTRQLVQVTAADFAAARADYTDLLAARQNLLQLELGRLRAAHDLAQAGNDLATLLGLPLDLLRPALETTPNAQEVGVESPSRKEQ